MLLCICPFFYCPLELWESFAEWVSVFLYIYMYLLLILKWIYIFVLLFFRNTGLIHMMLGMVQFLVGALVFPIIIRLIKDQWVSIFDLLIRYCKMIHHLRCLSLALCDQHRTTIPCTLHVWQAEQFKRLVLQAAVCRRTEYRN